MADLRRPSVRAALTLAVVVLGLFEVQSLLEILVSQSRLRERVARSVQEPLRASRPRIDALLEPGGPAGWDAKVLPQVRDKNVRWSGVGYVPFFDQYKLLRAGLFTRRDRGIHGSPRWDRVAPPYRG